MYFCLSDTIKELSEKSRKKGIKIFFINFGLKGSYIEGLLCVHKFESFSKRFYTDLSYYWHRFCNYAKQKLLYRNSSTEK